MERRAAPRELAQHGQVDGLEDLLRLGVGDVGQRRERAHPAGVRAGVAVADALVVARRGEDDGRLAGCDREDRELGAFEQLLDVERLAERRRRASASSSSSCVRQTQTPLPAASPSSLTTHGGSARSSVRALGTPAASITSFANAFDPSICAAAALGPKTAMPRRRSSSASPATSGASGPTTTRSTRSSSASAPSAAWSSARTGWHVASAAMPGLPGAAWRSSTAALRESDHASACSRASRSDDEHPHRAIVCNAPAMDAPPYSAAGVDVVRLPGGASERDRVAVEEPLEIRIGGEPVAVTMRTPGHDEELALGFCLSEGLRADGRARARRPRREHRRRRRAGLRSGAAAAELLHVVVVRGLREGSARRRRRRGAARRVGAARAARGRRVAPGPAARGAGRVRGDGRSPRDGALHRRGRARLRARGRRPPQRDGQGRSAARSSTGCCRSPSTSCA